jgi:hypothetical protein
MVDKWVVENEDKEKESIADGTANFKKAKKKKLPMRE